jgi:hypothetical protein
MSMRRFLDFILQIVGFPILLIFGSLLAVGLWWQWKRWLWKQHIA